MKLFGLLAFILTASAAPSTVVEHVPRDNPDLNHCNITVTVYWKHWKKGEISALVYRNHPGTFKPLYVHHNRRSMRSTNKEITSWSNGQIASKKQNVDDQKTVTMHGLGKEGDTMEIRWMHGETFQLG